MYRYRPSVKVQRYNLLTKLVSTHNAQSGPLGVEIAFPEGVDEFIRSEGGAMGRS